MADIFLHEPPDCARSKLHICLIWCQPNPRSIDYSFDSLISALQRQWDLDEVLVHQCCNTCGVSQGKTTLGKNTETN